MVDDNIINLKVATKTLEHLGYAYDTAMDGHQAIQKCISTPYAAVLMDCRMPIMDGFDATQALRKSEHVAKDLPIIGLSANSMAIDEEQCIEVGMDCFLTKPLEIDVIDKTLKYLIAGNNKEGKEKKC
ncbi:MAG: response regulator [Bdellovibrionota bacterium]